MITTPQEYLELLGMQAQQMKKGYKFKQIEELCLLTKGEANSIIITLAKDGFVDIVNVMSKDGVINRMYHTNTIQLAKWVSLSMYKIALNMVLKKKMLLPSKHENPTEHELMKNQIDSAIVDIDQHIEILAEF